jgi:asparagine synthase (glutamine-hydrolysing)
MCGIFALLNNMNDYTALFVEKQFMKGINRGPEYSKLQPFLKIQLGFHRLSINGLNSESNQPLIIDDIVLICNGEIYNYKELYELMDVKPTTESDCEVIIHLYKLYGIEQTLRMLDGVFAFILLDNRLTNHLSNNVYIARDPYGVRPLYVLNDLKTNHSKFAFASELKVLYEFYNLYHLEDGEVNSNKLGIIQFIPGTYSVFHLSNKVNSTWIPIQTNIPYIIPSFPHFSYRSIISSNSKKNYSIDNYCNNIYEYLRLAVFKRCNTTERPIACLLSGGLDSSLIASLVNEYYSIHANLSEPPKKLETYSIGLADSEDLKYARIVANYLNTNHTEIIVTEQEMFDTIPEVIRDIESYDTTTVRASIGNYLLGKYISKNSDAKVIFNGDGSDELCGGYLYMNNCPNSIEFDKETRRLLNDIYLFDVLRSDKCISSHGLEPRTPFLDKNFVNYYLSIPSDIRNHVANNKGEKYLLRKSFSNSYVLNNDGKSFLPDEILWRRKEAFSDGVSSNGRSLYVILQEKIENLIAKDYGIFHLQGLNAEKYYYKTIFTLLYNGLENIVPYYWMPKFTNATDPSARTLDIYKKEQVL